ncbi:YceH family protein [Solitalea canadensis]|uniref:Uncharacterized protein n=1 Tax=Solitalea canadensis (strain ATCC 29591 / DSM 3403 / JCM 21819 / LMG 8368 / NBRC 15130 / NCIMB 12057 / USAM 9D) TaxID=929556 RepID=H8KKZ6_SOLCM|nr:YceH family protein [Solitalea canadensis]AFD08813.1 hypothetical protein Solca_3814 [Solitalea canadensis DSM 3403]
MEATQSLPLLDAVEQRVLGSLIEKSKTTPEYYPLTLNSLTAACNQKSSRKPVVNYDEGTIVAALDTLKKKGLISTATGGSSRAVKYKHNLGIVFPIVPAEVTLICLLMLRGPQTLGELNTNSGRMYEYESLEEIQEMLDKLSSPELPFVVQLPKKAGQKEARYMHLFGGTPSVEDDEDVQPEMPVSRVAELEERLVKVETELADMKEAFDKLMKELMG